MHGWAGVRCFSVRLCLGFVFCCVCAVMRRRKMNSRRLCARLMARQTTTFVCVRCLSILLRVDTLNLDRLNAGMRTVGGVISLESVAHEALFRWVFVWWVLEGEYRRHSQ